MADYGAYANPEVLYNAQNTQLAMNTINQYRQNMASSLDAFVKHKQAQQERIVKRNEKRRAQMDSASKSFYDKYIDAKSAADKFTSSIGQDNKEALNMANQIQRALYQVGEELNRKITEAGPDVSQMQIDQYTADAIANVTSLKTDLTNMYAAYEEYKEAKDLDPSDPRALLPNSNPQMQDLFAKLDDGEDNVILQKDASNGHWILIPVAADQDYTKIQDGTEVINYDEQVGIVDVTDYSRGSVENGGYFEFVGGPDKKGNYLEDAKNLSADLVKLAEQEQFSSFRRDVAENAPATKNEGLLSSDIRHITEYDHDAMKTWLLDNPAYLNTFLPSSLDGALQQIENSYLSEDLQNMEYDAKLEYYYDKLIDNALLRLPKKQ